SFTEYELKNMLYDMMQKSRSFQEHEKHLDLYNALIGSIRVDDAIAKGELDPIRVLKKRPSTDSSKGKTPSKPSYTNKTMKSDESVQGAEMDVEEPVKDNVVNVEEQPQDDAPPKKDNSIWFKQDVVFRPETPDLEWHKEPNVDDAPKQNWFNELLDWVNLEGDRHPYDLSKPLPLQGPPDKQFRYGYLKETVVRRSSQKEYTFKEPDFSRLHLNDIEDTFLLYVQHKLHNLTGDEILDLVNALRTITRSIVIQRMVEHVLRRVDSYHKKAQHH
nr:hypothetical protein [Tanacetum cinerariifolium]